MLYSTDNFLYFYVYIHVHYKFSRGRPGCDYIVVLFVLYNVTDVVIDSDFYKHARTRVRINST